jgi:hypothetical protein
MMKLKWSMLFLVVFLLPGCGNEENKAWREETQDPEFLHRSIKQVTDVIVHDIFSPPVAARIYSYMTVAAYEAALPGQTQYVSLAGQLKGLTPGPKPDPELEYSFEIASVQAALKVGKALVFSEDQMDKFIADTWAKYKKCGIPKAIMERSIAYGDQVADHILAWSGTDNYKQSRSFPKYTIEVEDPATWKPTPPAYMDAIEPHWNKIRTVVLDSAAQFRPAPPTPFSTDKSSRFFEEALEVYEIGNNLTDEQREIALFWDCNPFMMNVKGHVMFATKKISPGGHWMNITRVACNQKKVGFMESIEAYTRVSLALEEGFISCWDEKYRSRLIRPETYINQYIDENWVPLLQTPPFPEHTSGHSVISNASAVTLTRLFGDNFAYTDSTEVEFGLPIRSFSSFYHAAEEAAISRLYGGIHYRPAVEIGVTEGRDLGNFVFDRITTRKGELANAE